VCSATWGVLPLMRVPALPRGENLLSMPYGVYGGPLGDDDEVERELVLAAQREAERLRVGRLELRCLHACEGAPPLARSELYSTFVRDLPGTVEQVLAQMPKKARAEARKARDRHGLELVEGPWYVEDLARLFTLNKRELGSPSLPSRMFRVLLDELGDDAHVHLVLRGREPLMAVMSFVYQGTLLAYYAGNRPGSDREYSASNYMYMALQEWAVERRFARFDFGRSRRDSGAFRFKQHQGFEPAPLPYGYHLVTKKSLPALTPSNPRTAWLRQLWSRLPLPVVEHLSPPLARYLS
jgi:FemAB-related protein (PEP-CTERM system-associated)